MPFAKWRNCDSRRDVAGSGVDDRHRVRVSLGDIEPVAALIPHQRGRVPADDDVAVHAPSHQIDATHSARLGDAACIHANGFGAGIAALARRALLRSRLRSAKDGHEGGAPVGGYHGGDGLHAERDRSNQRSRFGVEYCECVVRGKGQHGETASIGAAPEGDGGCAYHVVTERRRAPHGGECIAGGVTTQAAEMRHGGL